MTTRDAVIDDPNYLPVLDHGFVGLKAVMGDDAAIVQAARISYGDGTKSVREDRGLIRYLLRHFHSSPFEMTAIKLHIRAPIFVFRQLFRHRTHAANEYSARYSVMSDDFYVPDASVIKPQSTDNRQGRSGEISADSAIGVQWMMRVVGEMGYEAYRILLGERTGSDDDYPNELLFDPYSEHDPLLDDEFPGVARELARTVLPVSYYSECYWQQSLLNMFKLLKLRADSHAQTEIRAYADAIYSLIKPLFPLSCEAWEDYSRDAMTLSRMETALLADALRHKEGFGGLLEDYGYDEAVICQRYGMTKRELGEFKARLAL